MIKEKLFQSLYTARCDLVYAEPGCPCFYERYGYYCLRQQDLIPIEFGAYHFPVAPIQDILEQDVIEFSMTFLG